ncbi:cell division site-positioning protein MapZ family protein [Streptococcus sp. E17BB]|uniref:cell division site-positioning protein MapZ family protein n=1 Tax=Streptococcus sp. E17BB TaxID=3278714 RepID=UPI00359EF80A
MSKENTPNQPLNEQNLDFEQAREMTVEEAVQKEADLAAGVTAEDSVLDKYIKKNRDKIGEQKFANKDNMKNLSDMDTSSLDNFIEKQRQELETQVGSEEVAASKQPEGFDQIIAPVAPVTDDLSKVAEIETFYGDDFTATPHRPKRKGWIIGSLAALFLGIIGLAYGLNQFNKQATTNMSSSQTSTSKSSSTATSSAKPADVKAFDDLYKTFFADDALTKPKNSEFDNITALEDALKTLEGTSDYEAAKAKVDSLKKAITAITPVNEQFETPAIVNGEKVEAKVKEGASFDHLTASVLNTGKANLDTLLQGVITEAKGLANSGTAPSTTAQQDKSTTPDTAIPDVSDAKASKSSEPTVPLQRELSRVPYNQAVIADSSNPAWAFNDGVLEEILRVSRERGYFTGDNYILEPVNIINGNGYYNLFKSDGTYLFSINAKTGYFVGNGAGHADALDY